MNVDNISQALILIYDTLQDDEESQELIEQIDSSDGDEAIKDGIHKAVKRLETVNPAVAQEVRNRTKGFAF